MERNNSNYSRILLVDKFVSELIPKLGKENLKIAIIGGDSSEPELVALQTFSSIEVNFFGIETGGKDLKYLDLNYPSKVSVTHENFYDLVICSQVLEHVWALDRAFENLTKLIRPGGVLWISCPASNFVHGSPEYFSAGYVPEVLENFSVRNSLLPVSNGTIGSKRFYLSRHALLTWLGEKDYRWPIFAYFPIAGNYPRKFFYQLSSFPIRIALTLASKKLSSDPKYAVETWGIFQKPVK